MNGRIIITIGGKPPMLPDVRKPNISSITPKPDNSIYVYTDSLNGLLSYCDCVTTPTSADADGSQIRIHTSNVFSCRVILFWRMEESFWRQFSHQMAFLRE